MVAQLAAVLAVTPAAALLFLLTLVVVKNEQMRGNCRAKAISFGFFVMNVSRFSQPLIIAVFTAILSGCATTDSDSSNIESLFASNTSTNMSPVENAKSNHLRFRFDVN